MAAGWPLGEPVSTSEAGGRMRGTIVCSVSDTEEGRSALELAAGLSERLGLRLVLAHVASGIELSENGDGDPEADESVSMKANRQGAARLLERLATEYGVPGAERREAVGDEAAWLGQIAAEEAADVILVGARPRGRLRRGFESRVAGELETETPVPVLIAPPRTRR
jgi:nucleotide-binding universal stress UspA family protein